MSPSIETLLREGARRVKDSTSPRLDVEILLATALGKPRSYLMAWPDRRPDDAQLAEFERLLGRRAAGEPVAYLTGRREFWSLSLEVDSSTLVPRPDTELLVERALADAGHLKTPRIADLGTGSGAIALAVASELPGAAIVATDNCAAALAVAARNAARLGLTNVTFIEGNWLAPLAGRRFDLIVSNPPYIEPGDPVMDVGDLVHEPRWALEGRGDGLDDSRIIATDARLLLADGGALLLEHGDRQGDAVRHLLAAAGYRQIETWADLAGLPRVTGGRAAGGECG